MTDERRLPDAIGIGFRRCASSWLHACLSEHPAVGKSQGGIHYFSQHSEKGVDWYRKQFEPFGAKECLIDLSVSYGYPENIDTTIAQIHRVLPDVKIFALVRDPVQRAYSDYRRSMFKEEYAPGTTFEQAVDRYPELLERGRYRRILLPVLERFAPDRLQIFFFDDIERQPERFWQDVCRYLRISPAYVPTVIRAPRGHLAAPRNATTHALLRRANRAVTSMATVLRLEQALNVFRRSQSYQQLISVGMKPEQRINSRTVDELADYFREDIAFLANLTGRDLAGWGR